MKLSALLSRVVDGLILPPYIIAVYWLNLEVTVTWAG